MTLIEAAFLLTSYFSGMMGIWNTAINQHRHSAESGDSHVNSRMTVNTVQELATCVVSMVIMREDQNILDGLEESPLLRGNDATAGVILVESKWPWTHGGKVANTRSGIESGRDVSVPLIARTGSHNLAANASTADSMTIAHSTSTMLTRRRRAPRCRACSVIQNRTILGSSSKLENASSDVGTVISSGQSKRLILEGWIEFLITAYGLGCDAHAHGITKAGTRAVAGFTIAADPYVLPIGSIVDIEGLGERMVHDIGPKVRGYHIDVFMDDCSEAWRFTRKRLVRVVHIPGKPKQRQPEAVIVRGTQ